MTPPSIRVMLVGIVACAVATTPRVPAQSSADLFDPQVLQDIKVFVNTRDLQQLRARSDENRYYPADIQWRDIRVRNVGIRSRGRASRSATKPGLQVDFDRYTTGQRFAGLKSLVLDNLWQDPAMLREKIAMAFFNRMGEPAPRVSFARLYINNVYQGLYGVVEAVDDVFLARTVGENTGYLFEYKMVSPFHGQYLGDDLSPYKMLFEPRNHQLEPDSVLYRPIRDLFREVNHEEDAVWRERVEEYLHLSQFVTHVAIETFLAEDDGILGMVGMANFYLYRHAESTVHRLIAWDKDLTFTRSDSPIMLRADENELFRRALAYDDLRELYLQRLATCARAAQRDRWLSREIADGASLLSEAVYSDPVKPFSNEEFDAGIRDLKVFARRRPGFVLREVAAARR